MAKFKEIAEYLDNKKIEYKVIDLPEVAVSVADVVRLSKGQVKEEEIVKTLIARSKDGMFKAFVLRGVDRLKSGLIERLVNTDEVFEIAKVEFGAVCPIMIGIPMVIDKKVESLKRVNMGSGDHLKGLEMDFSELLKAVGEYTIEEISL